MRRHNRPLQNLLAMAKSDAQFGFGHTVHVANGLGLQPLRNGSCLPDEAAHLLCRLAAALNLARIAQSVPKPTTRIIPDPADWNPCTVWPASEPARADGFGLLGTGIIARLQVPTLSTKDAGQLFKALLYKRT